MQHGQTMILGNLLSIVVLEICSNIQWRIYVQHSVFLGYFHGRILDGTTYFYVPRLEAGDDEVHNYFKLSYICRYCRAVSSQENCLTRSKPYAICCFCKTSSVSSRSRVLAISCG